MRDDGSVPRTVLIVDDSAPFRTTARALLEARGYTVAGTAADGAGALDAAAEPAARRVLLDVNLPDMDGMTVADGSPGRPPARGRARLDRRAGRAGGRVEASARAGSCRSPTLGSPRLMSFSAPGR